MDKLGPVILSNAQEELRNYIANRVTNISNDCRSFIWLRVGNPEILTRYEKTPWCIGGGNFLMAMGLFAVLEVLANVFRIIQFGNSCLCDKQNKGKCLGINAEISFSELIPLLPSIFHLGLENCSPDELKKLWKQWRNSLTHFIIPDGSAVSFDFREAKIQYGQDIWLQILGQHKAFEKLPNGKWICYVDVLAMKIDNIGAWVQQNIDNSHNDQNIEAALEWYKSGVSS